MYAVEPGKPSKTAIWVAAIRKDARRVVILGDGLDTRAYRLKRIEAAEVFEVDYSRRKIINAAE